MSSPSTLNKIEETTPISQFHSAFQREKVNEIRYFKGPSKQQIPKMFNFPVILNNFQNKNKDKWKMIYNTKLQQF